MSTQTRKNQRQVRHAKIRQKIVGSATKPRLSVFRSNRCLYGQLIDDNTGRTLVASGQPQAKKSSAKNDWSAFAKASRAYEDGRELADKAKVLKIVEVVFDRGGYRYAGRVKAFAEGARAGGLKF